MADAPLTGMPRRSSPVVGTHLGSPRRGRSPVRGTSYTIGTPRRLSPVANIPFTFGAADNKTPVMATGDGTPPRRLPLTGTHSVFSNFGQRPSNDDASLDASKDNAWSPNGDDDSWIDDWDFVIRRCTTCDRPFRTEARLRTHVREYHDNPSAKTLPQYRSPKQLREITSPGERPERVDIISSGDLEIVTSTTVIRVASQVLWTASPVFNAMFGPQSTYSEAKNLKLAALDSDTRAVITVDDNPIALRTVLEVLHHKRVYTTFTFDQLVRIAEVADKYQIAPIIKPRMEKWIQLFEPIILTPGYEDALTISWVFGLDTLFQKITKGFGARAVVDENGQLLLKDSHGKRVEFSDSLPEIALKKLAEKKIKSTEKLRMAIEKLQADRTNNSGLPFRNCKHSGHDNARQKECCYMNVGYLIATVDELGLNNDDTWKGDVSAVLESLKKLEVLEILDDNTNESPHGGIIAHSVSIRRNVPMRPLPSDLPSRYNHKDCSWVPDLKSEADAASNIDFTLTLWDFPSRRIHYW